MSIVHLSRPSVSSLPPPALDPERLRTFYREAGRLVESQLSQVVEPEIEAALGELLRREDDWGW